MRGLAIYHRVLRGGAFNNNRRRARCAYRNNNNPDNRNNNNGFRVVVSTLFKMGMNPHAGIAVRRLLHRRGKEKWRARPLAAPR